MLQKMSLLGLALGVVTIMMGTALLRSDRAATRASASTGATLSLGTVTLAAGQVRVPILASGSGFAAYAGVNATLLWDPAVFSYASNDNTGSMLPSVFCATSTSISTTGPHSGVTDGENAGCLTLSGSTSATGLLTTFVLTPLTGCSPLHLLTFDPPDSDPNGTGTLDASAANQTNTYSTIDLTVDTTGAACGAATNTPTPTNTPVGPTNTPTNTPVSTGTPTDTPVSTSTPTATATPAETLTVTWAKQPSQAHVTACDQTLPSCPSDPVDLGNNVWLNGIVLDEVMTNQPDPHGLGGYQLHVLYDPFVFQPAAIADLGVLSDNGVRNTSCGFPSTGPGDSAIVCNSTGPFGAGAVWTGPATMARVTLRLQPGVFQTIQPGAGGGLTTTIRDDVRVTNTCGQPLNDGSIQPLPGQNECQGNLVSGIGPGGVVLSPGTSTIIIQRPPSTPTPTNTPIPTNTRTSTPVLTNTRTNTPVPTNTPVLINTSTNTPVPTSTSTNTPAPINTATSTKTVTTMAVNTTLAAQTVSAGRPTDTSGLPNTGQGGTNRDSRYFFAIAALIVGGAGLSGGVLYPMRPRTNTTVRTDPFTNTPLPINTATATTTAVNAVLAAQTGSRGGAADARWLPNTGQTARNDDLRYLFAIAALIAGGAGLVSGVIYRKRRRR